MKRLRLILNVDTGELEDIEVSTPKRDAPERHMQEFEDSLPVQLPQADEEDDE